MSSRENGATLSLIQNNNNNSGIITAMTDALHSPISYTYIYRYISMGLEQQQKIKKRVASDGAALATLVELSLHCDARLETMRPFIGSCALNLNVYIYIQYIGEEKKLEHFWGEKASKTGCGEGRTPPREMARVGIAFVSPKERENDAPLRCDASLSHSLPLQNWMCVFIQQILSLQSVSLPFCITSTTTSL